ncbi:hypothetical protein CAEBREN_14531 [Caenorhabditis brenneri]|uniref:Uncharacterized protein n=1 Tax=Caenorhabditis brenneri TaxID=135651 RepID=G0MYN3_CAEBE|nr:hypothetical protein CAEBREN_14531 [Caenorhabditis brenneri]
MNHRLRNDPYFNQSTSAPSTSDSFSVYTTKLSSDQAPDDTLPSIVEADQMNAFMDDYLDGMDMNHSKSRNRMPHHISTHDDDLEELLKETADMKEIQTALQQQTHIDLTDKFRMERSRQKRAAAARLRYQRMTENERKEYNHRRRLRQLGVDPNSSEADQEAVRAQLKEANAKKAEAARQRYHRMTPEQKREYNLRRTEAFRKRRQEEERLLSTSPGKISEAALEKAQQILVRNARKAESARLRYQKMTPEERKEYNLKRASTKKRVRSISKRDDEEYSDYQDSFLDLTHTLTHNNTATNNIQDDIEEDVEVDESTSEEHLLNVINQVAHPPDELGVFAQMENEVIRRTKKANATLMKQNYHLFANNSNRRAIRYTPVPSSPETLADAEILANLAQIIEDPRRNLPIIQQHSEPPLRMENPTSSDVTDTQIIDEKALHDMVTTGHDANGLPVEIRTVDGQQINSIQDLINISHGQTVLITQRVIEHKPPPFLNDPNSFENNVPSSSTTTKTTTKVENDEISALLEPPNPLDNSFPTDEPEEYDYDNVDDEEADIAMSVEQEVKIKMTRARRAERARARYHRMSIDKRREQNARRAFTLRQARAREDELIRIGESTPADQLDPITLKSIQDAQLRRTRRAEQARSKYQKMTEEERKAFNQTREKHRKSRRDQNECISDASQKAALPQYQSALFQQSSTPEEHLEDSSFFF